VRTSDVARPQYDGDWSGPDYLEARVINMGLGIQADDGPDLEARRVAARQALLPTRNEDVLTLTDGRIVYAKLRKAQMPTDMEYDWRLGDIAMQFYCADPRVYGSDYQNIALIAGAPRVGGRTYYRGYQSGAPNYVAPKGWQYPSTVQTVASGTIVNNGNVPSPLTITITGTALDTPAIEVVGYATITLNLVVQTGDVLVITRTQQILLNGVARRDVLAVGSTFPVCPPGTWTVRLNSKGGTGAAQVEMRSASV
jgi:hypothetical protein